MKTATITVFLFIGIFLASANSCMECGEECRKLCGTKQFKACCFNYLKKRSIPVSSPDLKLEVLLPNPSLKKSFFNDPPPYNEYMPLAAIFSRQDRHIPQEQGRLQFTYDA